MPPFALWIGVPLVETPTESGAEALSGVAPTRVMVMDVLPGPVAAGDGERHGNIGAEIARDREESAREFAQLERRFGTVERLIDTATKQRAGIERWQVGIETTLDASDDCLGRPAPRQHGGAFRGTEAACTLPCSF